MKYIKSINEYRNQLEIPFDNKHPLHDKPNHIHVLDGMLRLTSKFIDVADYSFSDSDIEYYWNKNYEIAFDAFEHNYKSDDYNILDVEGLSKTFLKTYPPKQYLSYYSDDISKFITNNPTISNSKILNKYKSVIKNLSNVGNKVKDSTEFIRAYFEYRITLGDMLNKIKNSITNNNVIPIYRTIAYNDNHKYLDVYQQQLEYTGIGNFWTINKDKANSYCGIGNADYTFCGLVALKNINWSQTIFKSSWSYNEEEEIEVLGERDILIYDILNCDGVKLPITKPMLIAV